MKVLVAIAVVLLIAATTRIETAGITWTPGWPVRIGLAVAGLVLIAVVGWRRR
jgi:hypothetical protein